MAEQLPNSNVNRVATSSAQATISRLGAGTFGPGAVVQADYLFDTVILNSGVQSLDFFSVPMGGSKTIADTNMILPGQLPRGQAFEIHYINCRLLRGSSNPSTDVVAGFMDLLGGSFWRHFFPGNDYWLRHSGAEFLPRVSMAYNIPAPSFSGESSNFQFISELGISIKEIPQVIGEQVAFGLNISIPDGINANLNGAKLQVSYRTNLVKRS